jgi:FkbM family methyltransferase
MPLFTTLKFILQHPLNRNSRMRAIGRFLRWQASSRIAGAPIAVPYVNGTRLLVSRGMTGATGNVYTGLHEYRDMAFVGHYLRPGDQFLDVGANVGAYSILAASCQASVIAYEPVAETFRALDANVRINGFEKRVSAKQMGVGDSPGRLRFTSALDAVNHVAVGSEEGELVDVVRLDDESMTREHCVIKIDVEGFEAPVIDGARTLLQSGRVAAVVLETNGSGTRYGSSDDEIDRRMCALGFRSCEYEPSTRAIVPSGRNLDGNTIYVHDLAHVRERLRTAAPIKVFGADV